MDMTRMSQHIHESCMLFAIDAEMFRTFDWMTSSNNVTPGRTCLSPNDFGTRQRT
jgi:hypothetical protein